jgi:hypothetical protein
MHYLQEDAPRKEIDLSTHVRDIILRVGLNLLEILQRYAGDVKNKGTTRSKVDPKLRKRRDLKMLLLQKKLPPRKKEGMCTWLLQAQMQIMRNG